MPTVDAAYLLLDGTESLSGGFVGPAIHVGPDAGPFDPQALRIHIPPGTPTTGGNLVIEESHDGLTGWTEVATFAIDSIATHEERITWTKRYLRADVDLAGDPSGMTIGIMDWAGYRRKGEDLDKYIDKVLGYDPIAYWPLSESRGLVAASRVDPAQDVWYAKGSTPIDVSTFGVGEGIGDGHTAPWFDGITDPGVLIANAAFNAAFNGAEGTIMIWGKVDSLARWAQLSTRVLIRLYADSENMIIFEKLDQANKLYYRKESGNVSDYYNHIVTPHLNWFCMTMSWSETEDRYRYYYNGALKTTDSAIGTWVHSGWDSTRTRIGNQRDLTNWWGWLAHCAFWDTALDAPTIADLAIVP